MTDIQLQNQCIEDICYEMANFLQEKNLSYNGSAFSDLQIGGKYIPSEETILVRISDKIKRITSGGRYDGDNDFKDLCGYLIILQANRKYRGALLNGSSEDNSK